MERYEKEITWWFKELEAQSLVPKYLQVFPELKSRLSKYAIGILMWEMKGFISIENSQDVELIRNILKRIGKNGYFEKFDETFNEMTPNQVENLLLSDNNNGD